MKLSALVVNAKYYSTERHTDRFEYKPMLNMQATHELFHCFSKFLETS